jgi:hypothetical protein
VPHTTNYSRNLTQKVLSCCTCTKINLALESANAMSIYINQRLRQDPLYRLQWNVLDAAEDIKIATGLYNQTVNMRFLDHPLADKPLFDPPLSCIDGVHIRDFTDKEDRDIYYPKEERYQPPAAFRIVNEDVGLITLRQFFIKVDAYVGHNLEEIKRVKRGMYGELVTHPDSSQGRVITYGRTPCYIT